MKATKKKTNIVTQINKTKKQKRAVSSGQLFSNNHPETTVHGYGFDTPQHVKEMLSDLHNRDITYQFQVVNTMCVRAKEVFKRTKDPIKRKSIESGIKMLSVWLADYKKRDRHETESHSYMPVNMVNKLEPLAEFYNISRKARGLEKPTTSDEGFLKVYRRIKNIAELRTMPVKAANPTGETWDKHRNNYIFRRLSMLKNAGSEYGLYHTSGPLTGLPTVLHVNMIMWAYTPDNNLLKAENIKNIVMHVKLVVKQYRTVDGIKSDKMNVKVKKN